MNYVFSNPYSSVKWSKWWTSSFLPSLVFPIVFDTTLSYEIVMKLYLTIPIHKHRFFLLRNISKSCQTFGHIPTRYQVCQRPSHLHIRSTDKYLDEIWHPFTLETQYKTFYKVPKDNLDKQNEAISMFALLNACKQFYLPFNQV